MAYTFAKEISESYKGSEITFDKTTAAAVAKGFAAVNVQDAIVEAKTIVPAATQSVAGLVRNATDTEVSNSANVMAFVTPWQMQTHITANLQIWLAVEVIPRIPPAVTLPQWIYGGTAPVQAIINTYDASMPIGSIIVFEDQYTYVHGWGNGSSTLTAWVRRSIIKTQNQGWQYTDFWTLPK